ncbi:MAG: hypothetical protein V2A73_19265 [Pseudomonadota bacterium]
MHWTLLDGSPRGRHSNTTILLGALARGLEAEGQTFELHHLALPRVRAEATDLVARAQRFLLGFPLYTDAMPGQVMELVERLEPLQHREGNPPLAFLVQSGFPEAGQSRAVEGYLALLARRLGSRYLGTIVKGGVEGMQAMPPSRSRKLLASLEGMGRSLGRDDRLDQDALRALAGPDWPNSWRSSIIRAVIRWASTPYWNRALKRNGSYERRFDRPYESTE